jgi:hypothetical protein
MNRLGNYGPDSSGPVLGSSAQGNQYPGFTKGGEFLD